MSFRLSDWTRIALLSLAVSASACAADTEDEISSLDDTLVQSEPIIGGVAATDFPEAALINMAKNGQFVSACSGAVIAPRVVLTAGHCVAGFDGWIVRTPFAGNQQSRTARAVVFDYTSLRDTVDPNQHDVGLILLDTPINVTSFPTIATSKVPDGTQVVNIGRIQDGVLSNNALFKSAPIPVRDARQSGFPFDYIAEVKIQSGDSGGPSVIAGTHTIVAVNSGAGGGTEVLARVDLLADFIKRNIDANGGGGNVGGGATPPDGGNTPAPPPAGGREVESNNSRATANPLDGTLAGDLSGTDQDFFKFSLGSGARIDVALTPTGDAQLALFAQVNGQLFRVTSNDPRRVAGTTNVAATWFAAAFSPSGQQQTYSLTLTK